MRILLDTHSFLWMIFGDQRLSEAARREIENPANEVFISVASLWETAIKVSIGKLELTVTFEELITEHLRKSTVQILPISVDALNTISALPFHHRDPFDRLLIAQAIVEQTPIVTRDDLFSEYSVQTIW